MSAPQTLLVGYAPTAAYRNAAALGAIALLSILLLIHSAMAGDGFKTMLGVVVTLIFAGMALFFLGRSRDATPVVTIDAEGVFDRRLSDRTIPWGAILSVEEDMARVRSSQVPVVMLILDAPFAAEFPISADARVTRWRTGSLGDKRAAPIFGVDLTLGHEGVRDAIRAGKAEWEARRAAEPRGKDEHGGL